MYKEITKRENGTGKAGFVIFYYIVISNLLSFFVLLKLTRIFVLKIFVPFMYIR
jgi:hypothetical protein